MELLPVFTSIVLIFGKFSPFIFIQGFLKNSFFVFFCWVGKFFFNEFEVKWVKYIYLHLIKTSFYRLYFFRGSAISIYFLDPTPSCSKLTLKLPKIFKNMITEEPDLENNLIFDLSVNGAKLVRIDVLHVILIIFHNFSILRWMMGHSWDEPKK